MAETINIEQLEAQAAEAGKLKLRCAQLAEENRALLLGYCLVGAFLAGVLYALLLDMLFD